MLHISLDVNSDPVRLLFYQAVSRCFGTLWLAEEWLAKPCRYLAGNIPLDLVGNPFGFQAVEDYLERVELVVYQ